jgi:hypothetical protein
MKVKWYAVPAIGMVLFMVSGLVVCAPTATSPASNPDEGTVLPASSSSLDESSETGTPTQLDLYYCGGPFSRECFITLKTIKSLRGNSPTIEYITVDQSPWMVNYGWNRTSSIGHECSVDVWEGRVGPDGYARSAGGSGFQNNVSDTLKGAYCIKVYKTGDFTIQIKASGCEWWVRVGIESDSSAPNPYREMIVGKWQHGFSECPPNMARDYCAKIKKLPENEVYYLEFFEGGQVNRIVSGWSFSGGYTSFEGRYSLIGSKLEINWTLLGGYEANEIKKLSDDEMVLRDKTGLEQTFRRVN